MVRYILTVLVSLALWFQVAGISVVQATVPEAQEATPTMVGSKSDPEAQAKLAHTSKTEKATLVAMEKALWMACGGILVLGYFWWRGKHDG